MSLKRKCIYVAITENSHRLHRLHMSYSLAEFGGYHDTRSQSSATLRLSYDSSSFEKFKKVPLDPEDIAMLFTKDSRQFMLLNLTNTSLRGYERRRRGT